MAHKLALGCSHFARICWECPWNVVFPQKADNLTFNTNCARRVAEASKTFRVAKVMCCLEGLNVCIHFSRAIIVNMWKDCVSSGSNLLFGHLEKESKKGHLVWYWSYPDEKYKNQTVTRIWDTQQLYSMWTSLYFPEMHLQVLTGLTRNQQRT